MISRVKVQNYRSIADADVELGPLTVLVGRNGAGKSTFIDVMRLIHDALRFNLETAIDKRGGMASLCRWTSTGRPFDIHIAIEAAWEHYHGNHDVTLARASSAGYRVKHEVAYVKFPELGSLAEQDDEGILTVNEGPADLGYLNEERIEIADGKWRFEWSEAEEPIWHYTETIGDPHLLQLSAQAGGFRYGLTEFRKHLLRTTFYSIFPNTLREPQKPSSDSVLNEHGENLGTALKHILAQGTWKYDLIAAMRRLVGDVVDIRVQSAGGYLVTQIKHESPSSRDKWFNLSQESDGTLRMLGLLVAIYQDPAPSMIAIEEPELTIHPGALAVLADILREASGRTQVVLTTQSPDLVSHFTADELRVVERVNGITEIGRIDETQRRAMEQHLFTGGELLRLEDLRRQPLVGEAASA